MCAFFSPTSFSKHNGSPDSINIKFAHKHCEHVLIPTNGNSRAAEERELYQKTSGMQALKEKWTKTHTHIHTV